MNRIWEELIFEVETCKKCKFHVGRKRPIFGSGNKKADILFVFNPPDEEDEENMKVINGKKAEFFYKLLDLVEIDRENIYTTNILKCKNSGYSDIEKQDIETCFQYLESQIALINPKIIVTVGQIASKFFMQNEDLSIKDVRGKAYKWHGNINLVPLYDIDFLIRNSERAKESPRWQTWQDLKFIKKILDSLL